MSEGSLIEQTAIESRKAAEDWDKRLAERTGTTAFDERNSLDSSRSNLRTHFTLLDPVFEEAMRRPHDPSVFIGDGPSINEEGYYQGEKPPKIVRVLLPHISSGSYVIVEASVTTAARVDDISILAKKSKFRLSSIWKNESRQTNSYKYTVITVPPYSRTLREGEYIEEDKDYHFLKNGDLRAWSEAIRDNSDNWRRTPTPKGSEWSLLFGTSHLPTREPTELFYEGPKPIFSDSPLVGLNRITRQKVNIVLTDGGMSVDTTQKIQKSYQRETEYWHYRLKDGKIVSEWQEPENGKLVTKLGEPKKDLDFNNITGTIVDEMGKVLIVAGAYK